MISSRQYVTRARVKKNKYKYIAWLWLNAANTSMSGNAKEGAGHETSRTESSQADVILDELDQEEQQRKDDLLDSEYVRSRFSSRSLMNQPWSRIWMFTIGCCIIVVISFLLVNVLKRNTSTYFKDALIPAEDILAWNESELDSNLHLLSHWEPLTAMEWKVLVWKTYQPSGAVTNPDPKIYYLEIGVGVGAFSRLFLKAFPEAIGVGIDNIPPAIAIASVVLPPARMTLEVMDMYQVPEMYRLQKFDYVFFPGVACFANSVSELYWIMQGMATAAVIKLNGNVTATLLPDTVQQRGECSLTVPQSFWYSLPYYKVYRVENMDDWNLPGMLGRYAVYLTRVK